jgi:ribose 5-phosphate isomerase B
MIYIGSDHRGFEAKLTIINYLRENGRQIVDMGPYEYDKDDDYPDYAFKVAHEVIKNSQNKGILLCGSGIGMTVAANKVANVRAGYVESEMHCQKAREDDDINVLVLDVFSFEQKKDFKIIDIFLDTEFSNEIRHIRRLDKVKSYELQKL